MTDREAISRIRDHMEIHHIGEYPHILLAEALEKAIQALKNSSDEFKEDVFKKYDGYFKKIDVEENEKDRSNE